MTATCTAPCNAPATITLSAAATVAAGRTVSKVEFYDGATLLATDTTSPYSSTRTAVVGGSHSFTAKVYDNAATPLTAVSAAKVIAVNTAPTVTLVAACGANPCVAPATVTLTATPADPDGSIAKIEFYRGATLVSTKVAAPWTFTDSALAAGTYSYTAKAFDNAATPLSTTSTAQSVTVATAPTVTLTAACTAPCNAPAAITLTATTTVGAGRTVSKVEFYEGATLLATDTSSPYSSARTAVTGGSHSYTAKVYDNGTTPLTATSTVIAVAVNTAPTVSLAAVCSANPCNAPATVTLTATPADADGTISKVEFYRGATLLSTRTAAPWTYSDVALAAGSYSYTAKAFDNAATPLSTTSTAQAITVVVPVTPPTVTLTASCTAPCNAPATVTLSATATVASGRTVSKVEFYEGVTLLATDTTAPYSSARTSVIGGTHTYTAKVYDNAATPLTATSTAIAVAVNTAPTVSLTATCNASPCGAPATVTLTATPADSDGAISKVEFYRGTTLIATTTAAPWTFSDAARPAGTFSYTAKAFDNGSTPLSTTSTARSVVVVAATVTNFPMTIDGAPVTINLPGTLPPQVTFSALAGDVLSLRIVDDASYPTLQGYMLPQLDTCAIGSGCNAATPRMRWRANGYIGYYYDNGTPYLAANLSAGYINFVVQQSGDFTIRLAGYGTVSQSISFALIRAASPVFVGADTGATIATTARPGQPLQFQFPSAAATHAALNIDPIPGWSDALLFGDQSYSYLLLTPSMQVALDRQNLYIEGDHSAGSGTGPDPQVRFFSAAEVGIYTLLVTPALRSTGGVTALLSTARTAGTLAMNAAPVAWVPTRQPADGPKYQFDAVAGRTYSLFVGKDDPSSPGRAFSLNVEGISAASYIPWVGPGPRDVGRGDFTPPTSGTYAFSLLESERPALNPPILVSIAESFAPVVSFTYPAVNRTYLNGPYFNGVEVRGASTFTPTSIDIYAYYTGYYRGDAWAVASCTGPQVLPCNFRWGFNANTIALDELRPRSLFARATFANGATVESLDLNLVRILGSGVVVNPAMLNDGMTVSDDQISFAGYSFGLTAGISNISVFVNGVPVPTAAGGAFVANSVPLQVGLNTISLAAHTIDESIPPVSQYMVTRNGTPDFAVEVDRGFGRAPHTAIVRITNRANAPWGRISIDADDDKVEDRSIVPSTDPVVTAGFSYATPGRYTLRVTIYRPDGSQLYETRRYVQVAYPTAVVAMVAEVYAGIQDKLRIGDITAASNYISDGALERFRGVFQTIGGTNLAQYFGTLGANGLGQTQRFRVSDQTAELVVSRGDPPNKRVFRVYFVKDIDGLWRIIEM